MAYIKKEPIIEFITKGLNNPDKTKAYGYDAIEILTEIEYTPTADVVEVKHGHWIPTPYSIGTNKTPYECSRCGMAAEHKYEYCNCGAKMDGERKQKNDFKE